MNHFKPIDRLEIIAGDITQQAMDAIVNAANQSLLGGGGVDGAIHRAAGPQLLAECQAIRNEKLPDGLPTGEAVLTKGYQLPAEYVIHTVGPVWHGGDQQEARLLANCYHNCLQIAYDRELNSIAFPAISTGVYRYPKKEAAEIAFRTTLNFLKKHKFPRKVLFVVIGDNVSIYRQLQQTYS